MLHFLLFLCCLLASARAQDNALGSDLVFDVHFYMQRHPDVARFFSSNAAQCYEHWLRDGIREGRGRPHPRNVRPPEAVGFAF
jgi:hypothetical protein